MSEAGQSVTDKFHRAIESATNTFLENLEKLLADLKRQGDQLVQEKIRSLSLGKDTSGDEPTTDETNTTTTTSSDSSSPSRNSFIPTPEDTISSSPTNGEISSPTNDSSSPIKYGSTAGNIGSSTTPTESADDDDGLVSTPSPLSAERALSPVENTPPVATSTPKKSDEVDSRNKGSKPVRRLVLPPTPPRPQPPQQRAPTSRGGHRPSSTFRRGGGPPRPTRGRTNFNARATSMVEDEWELENPKPTTTTQQSEDGHGYCMVKYIDPNAQLYVRPS